MDLRPIGFFDSGLGGVSVLKSAVKLLPHENYLYFGDNGNAPYGDKTAGEITKLTFHGARLLVSKGVKAIVLACNTATGTCINKIRSELAVPVVSIEPAIKPACEAPGNGKVLMLATAATVKLARYQALVRRMPDPGRVLSVPCPGLVDRIEKGVFEDDAFDDVLSRCLAPYEGMEIDAIVLGCTHYPFIKGAIRRYAAAHFRGEPIFCDGSDGTAKQLCRVLSARKMTNPSGSGRVDFLTSGDRALLAPLYEALLSKEI